MRIIVFEGVSLDGVMQAPARPDENTRAGFRYGCWGIPCHNVDFDRARSTYY